jgi:hypothetical protein
MEYTYDCTDVKGNIAAQTVRTINIRDTLPPVLNLVGDDQIENSAGVSMSGHDSEISEFEEEDGLNMASLDAANGAVCTDACDLDTKVTAVLHFGSDCSGPVVGTGTVDEFPEYIAGDYSILYSCTDGEEGDAREGLVTTRCRHIQNVDHTHPVIQLLGHNHMVLEATHDGNYIDDGATCSDAVDGVISQNVEVSGDVVNLSKVGTYRIRYNCQDSAGNAAPTTYREVVVKQTSCPTCDIEDHEQTEGLEGDAGYISHEDILYREAGFPYSDAGITCSDVIDGPIPEEDIFVDNPVLTDTTGTYIVTYTAKNSQGLWNYEEDCRHGATSYTRTVVVQDTLKPVIKIDYLSSEVARGTAEDIGSNGQNNPMHPDHWQSGDPFSLMAEEQASSVNGWAIGAVASAVTGLALLGYSRRVASVPTAVPV